jgi:D-serine deaminase-like pyridoxal phosphate-dependent protein
VARIEEPAFRAASVPPAIIDSVPFAARRAPPDTGASMMCRSGRVVSMVFWMARASEAAIVEQRRRVAFWGRARLG